MSSERRGQPGQQPKYGTIDLEREQQLRKLESVALQILSERDRSEAELSRRLRAQGFERELIDDVFVRLRAYRYLNDARVAENDVRLLVQAGWGPSQIRRKLTERGLSVALIVRSLKTYEGDDGTLWVQKARERVRRDFRTNPETLQKSLRARVYRHLLYCGFASNVATEVVFGPGGVCMPQVKSPHLQGVLGTKVGNIEE